MDPEQNRNNPDKDNEDLNSKREDIIYTDYIGADASFKDPFDGNKIKLSRVDEVNLHEDGSISKRSVSTNELGKAGFYSSKEVYEHLKEGGDPEQVFSEMNGPVFKFKGDLGQNEDKGKTSLGSTQKYRKGFDEIFGKNKKNPENN